MFHKKYIEEAMDENLISGFLSAVNSFVGSFGAEIKWIEADKFRFVFQVTDQMMFVACTDINDLAPLTHKRLVRLADHFHMLFNRELVNSCDPISIDIFKKIAPTVNRLFGFTENISPSITTKPVIANASQFRFDSTEARLMSFIRYKRRVSINDIVRYLRISGEDVQETLDSLEQRRIINRSEQPDGSEHFGINPIFKGGF
ncbi:MAG: hypothetical protein FK733_10425 [Asgard group archaeon]|nr:hypothetical protein [Asgard group archaeon]